VLSDDPTLSAECALIVWYDSKLDGGDPLIVEFSFRYGNKKEKYSGALSQTAYDVFIKIQAELEMWVDYDNATKTGFIYKS
jgi:hypothetical protein